MIGISAPEGLKMIISEDDALDLEFHDTRMAFV